MRMNGKVQTMILFFIFKWLLQGYMWLYEQRNVRLMCQVQHNYNINTSSIEMCVRYISSQEIYVNLL